MKIKRILIVSVLAAALLGCGKHQPRHFIIMPDVSGSVERESLEQAFKAIDDLAGHLQRGDRLTIIPILGDAEAESSGRILRFEVPSNRQAYDTDLRDFRGKLNIALKEMGANAIAHPGAKTDILGSVALAEQEFQSTTHKSKQLLILSDYIEDDGEFDFGRDPRLKNQTLSGEFAEQIANKDIMDFHNTHIYLGLLRSNEYASAVKARRNAIAVFWITYFERLNGHVQFSVDGIACLKNKAND